MKDITAYEQFFGRDEQGFEKYQVYFRRKKVIELFNKYEHLSVLEIGCGLEPQFSYLDFEGVERYTVVEPVTEFCKKALQEDNADKITLINDFLENVESDEKYSLIICSSLLHEVEDQVKLLKKIYDMCDEKSIVHINVPNAKSFHRLLAKEMGLIQDEHDFSNRDVWRQHTRVFDMETLKGLLNYCGFEIVDSGSYFVKPFTHDQMMKCLDAEIISNELIMGLEAMTKYMPNLGSDIYCDVRKK